MAIFEQNGFMFYDWVDTCIVIEDHRIDEYVNYINSNGLKSIGINIGYYRLEDINFLEKCVNVEEVSILSPLIRDFNGLVKLKDLLRLTIDEHEGGEIDLSKLSNLEFFAGECNKYLKGIDRSTNLKVLSLSKYKPKNKNLEEFSKLSNLESLQIVQTQITSLKGIENLQKLKELDIYGASKLEYIDEIEKISQSLKILSFERCKKIKNHDYVTCLKELEKLQFDNCGEIPTIKFIRDLPKLKKFIFIDTNIVDGDLSPCIGLEYSGFFDKKHYSHKFKELNDERYWK